MGCLDSRSIMSNENANSNNLIDVQDDGNEYVDTDNFREEDYPLFQLNFFDKNIKNIKKVYEEITSSGNNTIIKTHKIFITIKYQEKRMTSVEIEIERVNGQVVKKHLKKLIYHGCYIDNIRILLEKYNSTFNIDSSRWYQSKDSTDIYVKAEKDKNNVSKSFQMYYEKDTPTLKINKKINYHGSDVSSEEECPNIQPTDVIKKYNELKSQYNDKKPEIYHNGKKSGNSGNSRGPGKSGRSNYSHHGGNDNNNNDSYSSYHNNDNESQHQELNRSGTMRNQNNQAIGKIDKDGVIRDECNREIGRFDRDGVVRDECNREIGRIDDDGVVRDECNNQRGKIESDGVVRDECNRELGRIDSDGVVRDANNNEIGRTDGVSTEQAAYMYFFK